jgi:hypothetical protein
MRALQAQCNPLHQVKKMDAKYVHNIALPAVRFVCINISCCCGVQHKPMHV